MGKGFGCRPEGAIRLPRLKGSIILEFSESDEPELFLSADSNSEAQRLMAWAREHIAGQVAGALNVSSSLMTCPSEDEEDVHP